MPETARKTLSEDEAIEELSQQLATYAERDGLDPAALAGRLADQVAWPVPPQDDPDPCSDEEGSNSIIGKRCWPCREQDRDRPAATIRDCGPMMGRLCFCFECDAQVDEGCGPNVAVDTPHDPPAAVERALEELDAEDRCCGCGEPGTEENPVKLHMIEPPCWQRDCEPQPFHAACASEAADRLVR